MAWASPRSRSSSPRRRPRRTRLDRVFLALSDPVRRAILDRLGEQAQLVSELAAPSAISLRAVSQHIQVLVRAGLVSQARTGRISRCSPEAGPVFAAARRLNYSKYWQGQVEFLGGATPQPGL